MSLMPSTITRLAVSCLRCPYCELKLGDKLEGIYETLCPRCKTWVTYERRNGVDRIRIYR